ncbi:phosphohydrolase [Nocardia iowensis]|uniref:Phosphohydrolase n=1 Tax=Nocardia iowensis TaxID=204891 RepID=A0ABX8RS59_NOCIO|nr:phosphohydrolase [Nocardia iowensis]QXN90286.1 phosphohydrolase [Nocardia iowensis]
MAAPAGLDWAWAQNTCGKLTTAQRVRLMWVMLGKLPDLVIDVVRARTGHHGPAQLELADARLPDTALARRAEHEARAVLSAPMLEHAYRSYWFARVLASVDGADYDDELAYVSCLLHGITLEHPSAGCCFAVTSARRAIEIALEAGETVERTQDLAAGIAGHLSFGVSADLSDPAGFVAAGTLLDTFGIRLSEFDPAWVRELLLLHPRSGFEQTMVTALRAEAAAVPAGRTEWLTSWGFTLLIGASGFPSKM